jgi:hypothetical protein
VPQVEAPAQTHAALTAFFDEVAEEDAGTPELEGR